MSRSLNIIRNDQRFLEKLTAYGLETRLQNAKRVCKNHPKAKNSHFRKPRAKTTFVLLLLSDNRKNIVHDVFAPGGSTVNIVCYKNVSDRLFLGALDASARPRTKTVETFPRRNSSAYGCALVIGSKTSFRPTALRLNLRLLPVPKVRIAVEREYRYDTVLDVNETMTKRF